jgi:hypothetical protein
MITDTSLLKQIEKVYMSSANYKIISNDNCKNKKAIVFFSGNGIYFPDTEARFNNIILVKDRFEWENIANNKIIINNFEKIIFVRDVYKQWYVKGINEKIDNQEKVVLWLKDLLSEYKIVTVGLSAGGYMAVIAGIKLHAWKIFSFSGQWSIEKESLEENLLTNSRGIFEKKPYLIVNDNVSEIYYFYPTGCTRDLEDYEYVKNNLNVCSIGLISRIHGKTVFSTNFAYLLLSKKLKKYTGHVYSPLSFAIKTMGFDFVFAYSINILHKVITKIKG